MRYLKRFNESVNPSDLISPGELYSEIKDYIRWEQLIYSTDLKVTPIEKKDIELVTRLLRVLCDVIGNREIDSISVVESAINCKLGFLERQRSYRNPSIDEYIIFNKLEDGWWAIESKISESYSYYICDDHDGLKKFMSDLTSAEFLFR